MNLNHSLSRIIVGSAASLVAVTATTSAYADNMPGAPGGTCEKPKVCCDEPKPGPFAFAFPVDVNLNCPRDFYLTMSGLLMQAKQDGMAFAIDNGNGSSLPFQSGQIVNFSMDNHDWGYSPGLRFGLGFNLGSHDAWGIGFEWTWLNITNYKSYKTEGSSTLWSLWGLPGIVGAGNQWNSVSSAWNVHYNTLDLCLMKPYHVSRYLKFRPHFGVRAGWIDQHFGVHYGLPTASVNTFIDHMDNNFWGFGSRAGVMTDWVVGKGFSLFGNLAASLLFGKFETMQKMVATAGSPGINSGNNIEEDFYQNVPNMEMQLGFAWNVYFSKNRYRFSMAAAYEFHEWWDQFNMRKFYGQFATPTTSQIQSETAARGNLTLNGFSLSIMLDI